MIVLAVACGGALGALARLALGGWFATWAGVGYPWSTFLINAGGSLLLGVLNGSRARVALSPAGRAFLAVGLCGGFTTFSTFELETLALLQERSYLLALTYSLGSVGVCIGGVLGGMRLAGWPGRPSRRTKVDA